MAHTITETTRYEIEAGSKTGDVYARACTSQSTDGTGDCTLTINYPGNDGNARRLEIRLPLEAGRDLASSLVDSHRWDCTPEPGRGRDSKARFFQRITEVAQAAANKLETDTATEADTARRAREAQAEAEAEVQMLREEVARLRALTRPALVADPDPITGA